MIRYFLLSVTLALGVLSDVGTAFVHPGIPLTVSDLAAIKAMVQAGEQPWKSCYDALAGDGRSSLSYTMQGPFASVSRNPHINRNQWMSDMQAIWNLSRMWYFTGNTAYAQKARDILIAWANTQTEFVGMESNLDLGDYAYKFAGGAEILRGTWPGWTQADTDAVKILFGNVYWTGAGLQGKDMMGEGNKGSLSLVTGAAIAAFCDDQTKFDKIVYLFQTSSACGLPNTIPNGQTGESGRDQGHAYGHFFSLVMTAEILWKQGVDVYSLRDNRMLALGEYYSRVNLLINTPFIPYGTTDAFYWYPAAAPWDYGLPALNLVHGAYVVRKGMSAPCVDQRRAQLSADTESFMFHKTADSSTAALPSPITFPSTPLTTTGLTNLDIGGATPAGSGTYSGGIWTIKGSGAEIWTHGADSFHFTYKQVTGDCAIIARVDSVENTEGHAKIGVMIRESLAADTRKAWVAITPSQTVEFFMSDWSEIWGGSNYEKGSRGLPTVGSWWVKVERLGSNISLYVSADGTSWAILGVGKFGDMGSSAYIGLAVCSFVNGTLNTSTFSHVSMTGGNGAAPVAAPYAPYAVYASGGKGRVPLRWLESFGATSYKVKRSTTSGGPYTPIVAVTGSSYVDNTVTNNTTYYYVVSAVNSFGESVDCPEETVTPTVSMVNIARGCTATANDDNGEWNSAEVAASAFDGSTGTKWYTGGNTGFAGWLGADLGSGNAQVVVRYDISSANDAPNRDPKNWQLLGSNNGSTWTALDTRSGEVFANRYQTNQYTISNSTAYRYYRLNITSNYSGSSADGIQLSELALMGQGLSFSSGLLQNLNSVEARNYTGNSLSNYVTVGGGTFSKIAGPAWLTVASDGTLSGTPGNADVGENTFTVRVRNSQDVFDNAQMKIQVANTYSGALGLTDLRGFASQWMMAGCTDFPTCSGADLDGDADVDMDDFAELAFNWLADETLQLYLKFDETSGTAAVDNSLYSRPGLLVNNPAWSSNGVTGGALSFDGSDDYVDITGYQGITGMASRTCSAWIKTTAVQQGNIISWGAELAGQKWTFRVESSGVLGVGVWGGYIDTTTAINDGQWHHVAVVLNSDGNPSINEVQLYIDGIVQGTSAGNNQSIGTIASQDVILGAVKNAGVATGYYNGLMDEVQIYNRALSAVEIADLAQ